MDLIVSTAKFPESGETVLGRSFRTAPGGKGANQAIQAARLGAHVEMVGKVGADSFGKELSAAARGAGVETAHVGVAEGVSSAVGNVILEVQEGVQSKNRIIVIPGANMTIRQEDVSFLKEVIRQYDMVMLQLEIPMEINEWVAALAKEAGVPVLLNPAPSAPISERLYQCLDCIAPNEHEAADLTGCVIERHGSQVDLDSVRKAAQTLLERGVPKVLITLGESGAAVVTREGLIYEPCVQAEQVVDPTAAGDSFLGAFAAGTCMGMSDQQALLFANHTASITVSRMGAQPSLPESAEVLQNIPEAAGLHLFFADHKEG